MELAGSVVIVTGASSGIGAALAPQLAAKGATVAIMARREERLREVVAQCQDHTPDSHYWAVDLGDVDTAERVALEVWERYGRVDGLVNNAAIPARVPFTQLTRARVDEAMRVNFASPMAMTLALLPRMLERNTGLIVNVSSMGGRIPIENESAYNASKFALAGWSEAAYLDLWGTGVRVKLILPGPIDTEIWDQPDNEPELFELEKVPAADCAAGIVAAMEEPDGFEYYVPPVFPGGIDAKQIAVGKHANCDQYLSGMAQFAHGLRNG